MQFSAEDAMEDNQKNGRISQLEAQVAHLRSENRMLTELVAELRPKSQYVAELTADGQLDWIPIERSSN
jgi:cell division protein FtsB